LAQPTYVLDIPGGHGKVAVLSDAVTILSADSASVRDRHGVVHAYPPLGAS
jgi:lysine 2,3-aminomutase